MMCTEKKPFSKSEWLWIQLQLQLSYFSTQNPDLLGKFTKNIYAIIF